MNKEYNIFQALRINEKELISSAFIGDLLNPCGDHGHDFIFLQSFLKMIKKLSPVSACLIDKMMEVPLFHVNTEKHLDKDFGRADIWIKNKENPYYILIENKINAYDQFKQLSRYKRYLYAISAHHKCKREGLLIYLTPDGTTATAQSTRDDEYGNMKTTDYIRISYKDIYSWLEKCKMYLDPEEESRFYNAYEQFMEVVDNICGGYDPDYDRDDNEWAEYCFWLKMEKHLEQRHSIYHRRKYNLNKVESDKINYGLIVDNKFAIMKTFNGICYGRGEWLYNCEGKEEVWNIIEKSYVKIDDFRKIQNSYIQEAGENIKLVIQEDTTNQDY